MSSLLKYLLEFPMGYSVVQYNLKKYGVIRTDFNSGKSIKLYAEELGGNDFISLNYYVMATSELLKPCEMPQEKVIGFLVNAAPIFQENQ